MASAEQQLTEFFRQLTGADQLTLLAFAEFLAARSSAGSIAVSTGPLVVPEPEAIERPPRESVVAALKRLSKTYPMLDKTEMLGATSDLVATSIMQRTDAVMVVDELEEIFRSHYEKLKSGEHG
ncbi:MAG: Crp/Fnr family transcriptional regulator [Gammaproteobacteria bacterium]|nr:Crp/Fnr family transcriptional regulator [Gammaproteobacteria bacterium]MDH3972245.1 Crp/Fnr family transcriptional regulator [Gammaproteobacteria bacterium]